MPVCFRAFSFKKKSSLGTTKAEVPSKVNSSNVLANRNVNVPKNSLVTKSPLTFSNKLERPQKSKINSFFPVSSKGKSDSINPAGDCAPAGQTRSAVSGIKAGAAPTQHDSNFQSPSANLDASLGIPLDDWDDLDDFETPAKAKNDSFSSDKSGNSSKQISSPREEKTNFTVDLNPDFLDTTPDLSNCSNKTGPSRNKLSCVETKEHAANKAAISRGPSPCQDTDLLLDDYEVKMPRRRPLNLKPVISDSEDDDNVGSEPAEENAGNTVCYRTQYIELFINFLQF